MCLIGRGERWGGRSRESVYVGFDTCSSCSERDAGLLEVFQTRNIRKTRLCSTRMFIQQKPGPVISAKQSSAFDSCIRWSPKSLNVSLTEEHECHVPGDGTVKVRPSMTARC